MWNEITQSVLRQVSRRRPCAPFRLGGVLLGLGLVSQILACGASSSISVTEPTNSRCGVSAQASQATIAAAGGTGTIAVDTARECQWNATADVPWLSVVAGGSGQGAGTVTFSASANASTSMRTGGIGINGQRVEIKQEAAVCEYTVAPATLTAGGAGGDLHITVTTAAFCTWTAVSRVPWIVVGPPANGTGTADITLRVADNTGPARSGNVDVGGRTVVVSQDAAAPGCSFAVAPSSVSASAGGETTTLTVTAPSGCAWSATTDAPWISFTGPTAGAGNGTVSMIIAPNSGQARSATVAIAGQTVAVVQASAPAPQCTIALNPISVALEAAGGSATLTIATNPGCTWNVSGVPAWLSASAVTGAGPATLTLSAQPNSGPARSATVTIGGATVTVTQAAALLPCSYAISPATFDAPGAGGAATITVTAGAGCAWTTTPNVPSWIAVTGGSGTGNGTVGIQVQPNTGDARTATFTVAGQPFTVTQPAAVACSSTVTPTTVQVGNAGGTQTFNITTGSTCAWTAAVTTGGTWLTITSKTSGVGSGTVDVNVDRNHEGARSGTLTIAGIVVTINQDPK